MFVKGHSGNPGGRPADDAGITELARRHTNAVINAWGRIVRDKRMPPASRVAAGQALMDRAWGKPVSFTTGDAAEFKKAVELSDDELLRIARAGGLLLEGEIVSREANAPAEYPKQLLADTSSANNKQEDQ